MMLVLAAVFGFFISNSLTRPLRRIGTAVDAIGKGQLEVRAPVTTGPLELRQLAESINATSSRLIDLLEVQRSFVEDASHQLRTPLTALQLHLENLQYAEQRPTSEEFALVLAEVGRLNRLVESLLELARNESRNPVLDEVDLSDVAVGRVAFWRPLAVEHGLQLAATTRDKIRVFAIPGVLEQVVDNLLSNAFDATPAGGLIQVTVSKMGSTGVLHVIDTGPGLDATDRQLALRRFWRGRRSDVEGSGLGLAIVDQLLRLSGGSIELREAPGGGVDATVLLRLAP
jgi:signal transduction histidine kinase